MKAVAVALLGLLWGSDAAAQDVRMTLDRLFADEREHTWHVDPFTATTDGATGYNDRLAHVTPADQAANLAADRALLERLHAIDRGALAPRDRVSYDLFEAMVSSRIALAQFREWRIPLSSDSGFHADVLLMGDLAHPRTVRDYDDYVARLRDVPRFFDENVANMRRGVEDGFTLPAAVLPGIAKVIAGEQVARFDESPLWQPFAAFTDAVPEPDRARLRAAGRDAIETRVMPAYRSLQQFFEGEYRRAARATIAATALPDGKAYYAELVRYFTTLPDATPENVHRIGLGEVARIRAEMIEVMRDAGFTGDFAAFIEYLRRDPSFYATSADQLLKEAAFIAKEIDGRLPDFFGTLPRMPFGIYPVPAALAPNYTGGRYNPGAIGSAGQYWVNTFALETRPLYLLPALTLHEAVPGHHLQGSLARELTDVPTFRRNFYPHAFGEGWGLYAERLGEEMGVYHTPYQRFGRLSYEMWRACRLVVDTGMHSMGWTRDQARAYLADNTALSRHEVDTEIDRYIAWPGQALAYKIGELKIVELRERAQNALGARFDLRAFHDAVLANGGVTLPVLEREIDRFIAERAAAAQ